MTPRHAVHGALLLLCWSISAGRAGAQPPATPEAPAAAATAADADGPVLTLADSFTLALKRSEEIAIRGEVITESEGRFLQALSGALPRASFQATEKRQDGTGSSAFTLREIPERRFVFSQPLFSGFKEFAAMAAVRAERRQRSHERTRAEHLLFVDVSEAFYLLREQREDLSALEATRSVLTGRLNELAEREQLGRSRPSEVVSAEAQLRGVEAEIERIRGLETTALRLLEFLTGLPRIGGTSEPEPHPAFAPLPTEAEYLARAEARPDVRAAEEAWRAAKREVLVAGADFLPAVDVESNYYTKRVGNAADVDWDVLFTVDVPIFQGGETAGAVRQARARARQAKLRHERTAREAALDIQDAYTQLEAGKRRKTTLERALESTEEQYRLLLDEYRLNLVNNLEVLRTLEDLQEARRDVIHVMYEVKRLYRRLQTAIGQPL
jgi:outer membrane protein